MSDTPRVDEVWEMYRAGRDDDPVADFSMLARTLERELAAANLRCAEKAGEAAGLRIQLTAARAEIERLRGEIEDALAEGMDYAANGRPFWKNSRAKRVMEGKE